jgi:hypothetical protein
MTKPTRDQQKEFEVFVSYNSEDRTIVADLIRQLHNEGIRTWWDRDDITAGQEWPPALENALSTTSTVVIFIGPNGPGYYQNKEIPRAVEEKKARQIKVIPVILPGGSEKLPFPLYDLQSISFNGSEGIEDVENLRRLITAIKDDLPSPAVEAVWAQRELRAAILDYYKTQEANCEHLVFTPRLNKDEVKGSDIYVPLNLLVKRDEPEMSIPRDSPGSNGNEDSLRQVSSAQMREHPRGFWRNLISKTRVDLRPETARPESQSAWEHESWETVFRNDGLRLVFTGDAGSGKSFSLNQEIRKRLSHARNELENSRPLHELELPILVKASVLVSAPQEKVADLLLASLSGSSHSQHFRNWWRHAFNSERGRRLFIIIDGLDELVEDHKIESLFRKRMRELNGLAAASLIVSCRATYFGSRKDWTGWADQQAKEIRIAPLDEQQQLDLIDKWFGDSDRAPAVRLLVETNYAARTLCRTPVVLTLICRTEAIAERPDELTYASLYQLALEELLVGGWRDEAERPKWTKEQSKEEIESAVEDRRVFVSQIGWKLFETLRSENRFTRKQWLEAVDQISPAQGTTRIDATELFNDLTRVGVLTDAGPSNERWYSFAHRTLYEYFAAVGLVEREARGIKTIVKHMWCESRWQEVIRFAASMPGKSGNNSEALLRAIAKETGAVTTPSRPLQWLSELCSSSAVICVLGLLVIGILTGIFIKYSPAVSQDLKEHAVRRYQSVEIPSQTELTQAPFETIGSIANHLLEFYSVAVDSFYKQVLLRSNNQQTIYPALTWLHFLFPILLIMLPVTLLGVFLSRFARMILYRRHFLNQDDIFRTGLRIQAEIIGLNPVTRGKPRISDKEVRRVVRKLIASEGRYSLNIHGATEDGGIPESLLLILGGNSDARAILYEEFWLRLVKKRTRKLRRKNRWYEKSLSSYGRLLGRLTTTDTDLLFKAEDLLDVDRTSRKFNYTTSISTYVEERLNPDPQPAFELQSRSGWSKEQRHSALLTDLNELLQGPSLFDTLKLRYGALSIETIELLERKPSGAELIRLNRLLLEDAFPRTFRRLQKRSIRFMGWWVLRLMRTFFLSGMDELRELKASSELGLALRGIVVLPNAASRNDILCLLQEIDTATHHLLNAGESRWTFTQLDIYAAKILAITGVAAGKERLVELANRRSEGNPDTPLAVKELSSIDKGQGIRAAAACLAERWEDSSYYALSRESDFIEVLRNSEFKQVAGELVKMNIDSFPFWHNILFPWSRWYQSEAAADFLKQIESSDVLPTSVRESATYCLRSSSDRPWIHTAEWLEEQAESIRSALKNGQVDEAASLFDKSISAYQVNYGSNNQSQALDKIAAACDEKLLDKWFHPNFPYTASLSRSYLNLARLGRGPNGGIVEQALINWAKSLNFDSIDGADLSEKEAVILALGELGTKDAAATLIAIAERALSLRQRTRRRLNDTNYDIDLFWTWVITALGRLEANGKLEPVERNEVSRAIQRVLGVRKNWITYHVAARSMSEQNPVEALDLLLKGHVRRDNERWKPEYGVEPQLHDFAFDCRARIRKVSQDGTWYVATAAALKRPIRVRA